MMHTLNKKFGLSKVIMFCSKCFIHIIDLYHGKICLNCFTKEQTIAENVGFKNGKRDAIIDVCNKKNYFHLPHRVIPKLYNPRNIIIPNIPFDIIDKEYYIHCYNKIYKIVYLREMGFWYSFNSVLNELLIYHIINELLVERRIEKYLSKHILTFIF